jgi:hypothetical protein
MTVTTNLPDFEGQALLEGQYRIKGCGPFGNVCVCIARFTLDALVKIKIQGAAVSFTITEEPSPTNSTVPRSVHSPPGTTGAWQPTAPKSTAHSSKEVSQILISVSLSESKGRAHAVL